MLLIPTFQLVIATCLALTANGYSFQRPIRPSIVPIQTASHPKPGGYAAQQQPRTSGSVGVHSGAAGTRNHPTFKQPVGPPSGVRPYLATPSHIAAPSSVSKAQKPVPVRPYPYQHGQQQQQQQGPKGVASFQSNRPYPSQVNTVVKTALPKQPDSGKSANSQAYSVASSQAYPVGPTVGSNHVQQVKGAPTGPVRAEASYQVTTKNPLPQRWIPSYGGPQNPSSQQSSSLQATGGYLQQPSKKPTGHVSNTKKNNKEKENESFNPYREPPLQTAFSTTRKPISQATNVKPNRKNPGEVPSIIPQTISHSNALPAANNYQIHKNPTVSEGPSKAGALAPASQTHNYQIPIASVSNTSSQSESSTPSSAALNAHQKPETSLAPGEGGKYPAHSDAAAAATNTYQIPKPYSTPSAVSAPQTQPPQSTTTEHYQFSHQVKVSTESIVPQQYESEKVKESFSDESKEAHYKIPPTETKWTADYQAPQQSTYTLEEPAKLHSAEQTPQNEATNGETLESVSWYQDAQNAVTTTTTYQPSYQTLQPVEVPSTNPLTVPTTTPFSLPSFDGSAIPKYVLGTYSPLVLPEDPLQLAHSAYGVEQLGVEEHQDAPAQPAAIPPQSTGSYGAPAVSLDTIKNLPLSQQWGYYSAEPFQPASVEISQSDIPSGAPGGGYQSPQTSATAEINNPAPAYGFQQSASAQQNNGYPFNQQSSAGSEHSYATFKQTANAAIENAFSNQRTSSSDTNVGGRSHQSFDDNVNKPPVATLVSENALNEDGSFSYK